MAENELPEDDMFGDMMDASKSYDDSEMDITPMIDITFLLLIFFIVASKMDESAAVPLPPAKYGTAVIEKHSVTVTIIGGEGDTAKVYAGDATAENLIEAADIEAQEAAVTEYVQSEMADGSKTYVLLKAAKDLKHGEVSRIATAATKVEPIPQLFVAILEK